MKKIMIVDDAAFMRLALKEMLKNSSFEVIAEAENGEVAIEKYKKLKPDIVTMDITMPVMSGIDALKEIKKFDSQANVIMISAMGQESMVREAIISGAKSFILKPLKSEHVIETLEKLAGD